MSVSNAQDEVIGLPWNKYLGLMRAHPVHSEGRPGEANTSETIYARELDFIKPFLDILDQLRHHCLFTRFGILQRLLEPGNDDNVFFFTDKLDDEVFWFRIGDRHRSLRSDAVVFVEGKVVTKNSIP